MQRLRGDEVNMGGRGDRRDGPVLPDDPLTYLLPEVSRERSSVLGLHLIMLIPSETNSWG